MKKNKIYNYYKILVVISSIITIFLSIIIEKDNGYQYIFFIPIIYLVLFIISKSFHLYSLNYNGIFLLNIFMYIRYIISTMVVLIKRDFYTPGFYAIAVSKESNSFAIILIIIEMVSLFITIALFSTKFYENKEKNNNLKTDKYEKKYIGVVLILFTIICVILFLKYPNNFLPKKLLISNGNYIETETSIDSIKVIANAFKTIVMGILINNFIYKFQKEQKFKYIFY